jgi:hypothetical protein
MHRIRYNSLALAVIAICTVVAMGAGVAHATPVINAAKDSTYVFHDCAVTILTTTNAYPGSLTFDETQMLCTGGANLHIWNLSDDGGLSSALFNNKDAFTLAATVQLNSKPGPVSAVGLEGGLRVCPWWDPVANGFFNMRNPDGEIACFGGVLPFFSFTAAFGIHYVNNTQARQTIIYDPHCNTKANPATIEYILDYNGHFDSGPLPFNNCTLGEEAHGCYGIMDNARVGGRCQDNFTTGGGDPTAENLSSFFDVFYQINPGQDCPVPTKVQTWGSIKGTYR